MLTCFIMKKASNIIILYYDSVKANNFDILNYDSVY